MAAQLGTPTRNDAGLQLECPDLAWADIARRAPAFKASFCPKTAFWLGDPFAGRAAARSGVAAGIRRFAVSATCCQLEMVAAQHRMSVSMKVMQGSSALSFILSLASTVECGNPSEEHRTSAIARSKRISRVLGSCSFRGSSGEMVMWKP